MSYHLRTLPESKAVHALINDCGGLPCGNFSTCVSVNPEGDPAGLILLNPGVLHRWLQPAAVTSVRILSGDAKFLFSELENKGVERCWPFAHVTGTERNSGKQRHISGKFWVPVQAESSLHSSLPVFLIEVIFRNDSEENWQTGISWSLESVYLPDGREEEFLEKYFSFAAPAGSDIQLTNEGAELKTLVPPGQQSRVRIALAMYDQEGYVAGTFDSAQEIAEYSVSNWERLHRGACDLEASLPKSGDPAIDDALRWYSGAGVYLTRLNRAGAVLTMGYTDLNQRDSYWSSWIHLVLWPELERRMIEASAAGIGPDGKIPTCILAQKYERPDDIDINAYFVLRVIRYVNFHNDEDFAYRLWPQVMRALEWLIDRSPEGLPVQGTYWGDWKDVPGVYDRKYSPHACLLYLASLKQAIAIIPAHDSETNSAILQAAFDKGYEAINRNVENGGLWNGQYYEQVWNNGERNQHILQDQTVGILFGVVPPERASKIHDSLSANRCPRGVRETYPYYPQSFGYHPGSYHNGGIWPYLSFVDAWSRMVNGRMKEGLAIIRDTAQADLSSEGDWLPHEYVQAETGANEGKPIQAWNASLFGALYFGIHNTGSAITFQ